MSVMNWVSRVSVIEPTMPERIELGPLQAEIKTSPSLSRLAQFVGAEIDQFVPSSCLTKPDQDRRARLIARFGFLGAAFGTNYAAFYAFIGHIWGALIIASCSLVFAFVPRLMRCSASLALAGHALSFVLVVGFSALCLVEGGMYGHAIAWLASAPLCALLLLGRREAQVWLMASLTAGTLIVMLNMLGVSMATTYDLRWHSYVVAAGYLGLIFFMFVLGLIFEQGRECALHRVERALEHLEASNNELIRLNEEKNEFLGIAAHDLKNPLTVIISTAELLQLGVDARQAERLSGNIVKNGQRMLVLIRDLLDANAIEEGKFNCNLEPCDLQSLSWESIEANLQAAGRKKIRLVLESDSPCWVRADRSGTLQILDNLISNAIKYSPAHSIVRVRANLVEGRGQVFVRDQGPGISDEDQQRMFGKFTRLSAQPTGGESSHGLGLSIAKRLAQAMAGSVHCESEVGKGANFILCLPAEQKLTDPNQQAA